jgi:stearoyl-CoA desaturase (delta-9 desaturase)
VALIMRIHLWVFVWQAMRTWVAVHLKHHKFSDKLGDPHSPLIHGFWKIFLLGSFYYDRATKEAGILEFARHIPKSKLDWLLERSLFGLAIGLPLFAMGFQLWLDNWLWGVYAYFLHVFLYQWYGAIINSVGHKVGYRNYTDDDNVATNFPPAAWLIAGEGWHNNHHHNPGSPKFSVKWWEFDPGWLVIQVLILLKLAKKIRPTINDLEKT